MSEQLTREQEEQINQIQPSPAQNIIPTLDQDNIVPQQSIRPTVGAGWQSPNNLSYEDGYYRVQSSVSNNLLAPAVRPRVTLGRFRPAYLDDKFARDLIRKANENITLSTNATPEEQIDFFRKKREQKEARLSLTLAQTQLQKDSSFNSEMAEKALSMGLDPVYNSEDLKALTANAGWGRFNDLMSTYGEIPIDVITDPVFMSYATPETMGYVKALHDIKRETDSLSFTDIVSDSFAYTAKLQELAYKYNNQEISLEEKQQEEFKAVMMYQNNGDLFKVSSVGAGMFNAMTTPYGITLIATSALAGAAIGSVAGVGGMVGGAIIGGLRGAFTVGVPLAFGLDSFIQARADSASQVQSAWGDNSIDAQDRALNNTSVVATSLGVAALDVGGIGIIGKSAVMPTLRAVQGSRFAEKIVNAFNNITKAEVKAGVKEAPKHAIDRAQSFKNNLTKTFAPIGITYGTEVATEGTQGAIQQIGINSATGQSGGVGDAFWENASEAANVMAYLAPFAGVAGIRGTVRDLFSLTTDIKRQSQAAAEEAIGSNTDINREGKENLNAEILHRTVPNYMYFMVDDLKTLRDSGQFDFNLMEDERFRDLDALGRQSPYVAIDMATWISKYSNKEEFAALHNLKRPNLYTKSGQELAEAINKRASAEWRKENIDNPIIERVAVLSDLGMIRRDLDQKLNFSGKIKDPEISDLITGQITNFIEALHETVPSMSMLDIYETIRPSVQQDTLDTRPDASQDDRPSFDMVNFVFNFNQNESITNIEHELGHFYLESIHQVYNLVRKKAHDNKAMRAQRDELAKIVQNLAKWGGYGDYNLLDENAKRAVHENFAIGLVRSIVSGKADRKNPELYKFRLFLSKGLRQEIRQGLDPEQIAANEQSFLQEMGAENWTDDLRTRYLLRYIDQERKQSAQMYGFREIKAHRALDNFVQKMLLSERKREEFEQDFPLFDELLERLKVKITDETDRAIIQRLENDNLYIRASTQSAFDGLMTITGEQFYKGYRLIQRTIGELSKFPDARSIARRKLYSSFIRLRGTKEFRTMIAQAYDDVNKDYVTQIYKELRLGNRLNPDDLKNYTQPDDPLWRTLKRKKLIADKDNNAQGSTISLATLASSEHFQPKLTTGVSYSPRKSREIMLLEALANRPNTRRQALSLAMQRALDLPELKATVETIINDVEGRAIQAQTRRKLLKEVMGLVKKYQGQGLAEPQTGERITLEVSPESFAKTLIDNMAFIDLKPRTILKTAMYYQNKALKAIQRDDLQGAALAFEQEEYLIATTDKAFDRKTRAEKRKSNLLKFLRKPAAEIAKTHDIERITIARALLARAGILPSSEVSRAINIISKYGSQAQMQDLQRYLSDETTATFYKNMTVKGFEILLDAVEEQIALAKEDHQNILEKQGINAQLARQDLVQALDKLPAQTETTQLADGTMGTMNTNSSVRRGWFYRRFQQHILKPLQMFEALDSRYQESINDPSKLNEAGPFVRFFYRPFRLAESRIKERLQGYRSNIIGVFNETTFKQGTVRTNFKVVKPEARGKLPEDLTPSDFEYLTLGGSGKYEGNAGIECLGIVLHMGNESNFNKLCNGYNVTKEEFMVEFNRLWQLGYINESIMQAADAIWKQNQSIFVDAQKAHRQCHGFYARELDARPIVTPDGKTYGGGYVPALTNPALHDFDHVATDIAQMLDHADFRRGSLVKEQNQRWAQTRNENFAQPLSLDPEALLAQNERLIRYAENAPMVMALVKLVESKTPEGRRIRSLLNRYDSQIWDRMIIPWLSERIHGRRNPDLANPWLRFLNGLIRKTGASIMCANISNTLQQITGLVTAMSVVPQGKLRESTLAWITQHGDLVNEINNKSTFMRTRLAERQISIDQSFNNIMLDPKNLTGLRKLEGYGHKIADFQMTYAYFMQKAFQNQIDRVVWYGAYRDALDNSGLNEADAIAHADEAVIKTQTSYDEMDLNGMEKSSALTRVFCMFGSYAMSITNLIYGEWVRSGIMPPSEMYKKRTMLIVSTLVVPSIMADLVNKTMSRDVFASDDDNDDDGIMQNFWFDTLVGSQIRMATSMVPFIGQILQAKYNELAGKNYYTDTRFNSPVFTVGSAFSTSFTKFFDESKEIKYSDIRNVIVGISSVFPIPFLGPIGRSTGYLYGVQNDQIEPTGIADFITGFLTGKVSPDSKQN